MKQSRARQIWIISFVATIVLMVAYVGGIFAGEGIYLTDSKAHAIVTRVSDISAMAAAVTTVIAAVSFIRYKKMKGIEKIKPICIALLTVWVTSPVWTIFLDIPVTGHMGDFLVGLSILVTLVAGFGVLVLSIIYLVYSWGQKTAKYPVVICLSIVSTVYLLAVSM
ncbi:hypothetical protein [Christensenella intestinihominis]|uniref:hypothetical protein n=1 Tax=Christensenella intestinihominis TaxID=1851429 RepID=UPI0011CC73EE|nr:hypothetical protein [Christensenella intestinihominis]